MKVRYDLAASVTPAMVLEEALANRYRYKAEPLFSKTGTGSLSPSLVPVRKDQRKTRRKADARSMARIRKLAQLAKKNGAKC